MEMYHDSLLTKLNYDEDGNVIAVRCEETQTISQKAMNQLVQFPDEYHRVTVINTEGQQLKEVFGKEPIPVNGFRVNYSSGIVFFNQAQVGEKLTFRYLGKGMDLISTNRLFHKYQTGDECIVESLDEIVDGFIENVDDVVTRGSEAIDRILETDRLTQEREEIRIQSENERVEAEAIRQQQAELHRQEEQVRQDNEADRIQAEAEREATYHQKLEEWQTGYDRQMVEFERDFTFELSQLEPKFETKTEQWHEAFNESAQQQFNQLEVEFNEQLVEWGNMIPELGATNDNVVSETKTWSSAKINQELEKQTAQTTQVKGEVDKLSQKVEQTQTKLQTVEQTLDHSIQGVQGEITDIQAALNQKVGQSETSTEAVGGTIVKRNEAGGINVSSVLVNGVAPLMPSDLPSESGSWTPRISIKTNTYIGNATIDSSYGTYCRVGRLLFLTGAVNFTTREVGEIIITGMPFTPIKEATSGSIAKYTKAFPANTVAYARIFSDGYLKIATQNLADPFSFKALSTVSEGSGVDITGGLIFSITYVI